MQRQTAVTAVCLCTATHHLLHDRCCVSVRTNVLSSTMTDNVMDDLTKPTDKLTVLVNLTSHCDADLLRHILLNSTTDICMTISPYTWYSIHEWYCICNIVYKRGNFSVLLAQLYFKLIQSISIYIYSNNTSIAEIKIRIMIRSHKYFIFPAFFFIIVCFIYKCASQCYEWHTTICVRWFIYLL